MTNATFCRKIGCGTNHRFMQHEPYYAVFLSDFHQSERQLEQTMSQNAELQHTTIHWCESTAENVDSYISDLGHPEISSQ